MRMFLSAFACFLLAAPVAIAQMPVPGGGSNAEAARAYFGALVTGDHQAQLPLLEEDAVFEDPTSRVQGRDAIVESWRRQNVRFLGYTPHTAFYSDADQYVFAGAVQFEQTFQRGDGGAPLTFTFDTPYIVILRVEDGRVVWHRDYVDTAAFAEQLNAQIAAAQEAPTQ